MIRVGRRVRLAAFGLALAACGPASTSKPEVNAARSTLVASPSAATADGVATVTVTATARDGRGAPLAGRMATFVASGVPSTLSSPTARTGSDGTAAVTLTSMTAGAVDLSVSIGGVAVAQHATATFVAGPPASITFTTQPTGGVAGTPFGVAVGVSDAQANPVRGATVALALQGGSPEAVLVGGAPAETDASGVASFPILLMSRAGRGYTVVATSGTATRSSASFDIAAAAPSSANSRVQASPAVVVAGGSPSTISVVVVDPFGNPVPDALVTLDSSVAGDTLTSGSAAEDGTTTATAGGTAAGERTITVTADGVPLEEVATVTVRPASPEPSTSTAVGPPGPVVADGTGVDVAVIVRDAYGNPVPELEIQFRAEGASVFAAATHTGADGRAGAFVGSTVAGSATVVATFADASLELPISFVAGPPDPAGSSLLASPTSTTDDGTPVTLTVTLGDRFGNRVAGRTVTFSSTGEAQFMGPTTVTGADGTTSGTMTARGAGVQTVSARVGTLVVAQTDVTFTAAPADPGASSVAVTPAVVPADGATAATAIVALKDGLGRPLPGVSVSLDCSAVATISPSTATTDAEGLAAFTLTSSTVGEGIVTATAAPGAAQVVIAQRPPIAFAPAYAIGGTVADLVVPGLVLASPGLPELAVGAGATSFAFGPRVLPGTPYAVTVKVQPRGQSCAVANAEGTVGAAPVTDVVVTCTGWIQIAAGRYHTVGLKADGTLWAWGLNWLGQLGTGDTVDRAAPTRIGAGFVAVAAGASHTLAVKADGTLWAWGYNVEGQLGDGTTTQREAPVQIGTGFRAVAAGDEASAAIDREGALYTWGNGAYGQLGTGSTLDWSRPYRIGTGYAEVAVGFRHMVAVRTDGTLLAWGGNTRGQLGTGDTSSRVSPAVVGTGFATAAAGDYHTLAVRRDGTLLACGENVYGALGTGDNADHPELVTIGTGYAAVAAGSDHSLALRSDGGLLAFGRGEWGRLGHGGTDDRLAPVLVGTGFARAEAGQWDSFAIADDGTLWAWGNGREGQLGGTVPAYSQPLPVRIGLGYASVAAGQHHVLAVRLDGTLVSWGENGAGQLGTGDASPRAVPTEIGTGFTSVAASENHSFGIKADGSLWAWGANQDQQLGTGDALPRAVPTLIGAGFASVSTGPYNSVALKTDGSLWVWGSNSGGALGTGPWRDEPAPARLGAGYVAAAAAGRTMVAVKDDGSLWTWGMNASETVGGPPGDLRFPTRVAGGYVHVAAGYGHSAAIKLDGTLMTWGANMDGELGLGDTYPRAVPWPVGTGFAHVVFGRSHSMALGTGGTLYAAGLHTAALGLGPSTPIDQTTFAPVGPGFVSVAVTIASSAGVRSDGTLWTWGSNGRGELGMPFHQLVPAPVPEPAW